jgi:site-specific DNA-methyltransferase (adenine-specific)
MWQWNMDAKIAYNELTTTPPASVASMIESMRQFIGANDMMAYLVMMAQRKKELHRVLKPTGSLYLHCDSPASHYLKMLMDTVFGSGNFRAEIIWKRTSAHGHATQNHAAVHDTIPFYSKSSQTSWNLQYQPYDEEYIATHFVHQDEDGRRFRRSDMRNPGDRPKLVYEYKGYQPHSNGWAGLREKMEQLDREGRLFFPAKGTTGRIRRKIYLDESPGSPVSANIIVSDSDNGAEIRP